MNDLNQSQKWKLENNFPLILEMEKNLRESKQGKWTDNDLQIIGKW